MAQIMPGTPITGPSPGHSPGRAPPSLPGPPSTPLLPTVAPADLEPPPPRAMLQLSRHPSTEQAENPAAAPGLPGEKSGLCVFPWCDHWAAPQGTPAGCPPKARDQSGARARPHQHEEQSGSPVAFTAGARQGSTCSRPAPKRLLRERELLCARQPRPWGQRAR